MGEPPVMETQEESGVELSPPVRQAERSLLLRWGGGRSSFSSSSPSPSDSSSSKNPLVAPAAVLVPEPEQQQLAPITGITLVCSDLGELVPRGFDLLRTSASGREASLRIGGGNEGCGACRCQAVDHPGQGVEHAAVRRRRRRRRRPLHAQLAFSRVCGLPAITEIGVIALQRNHAPAGGGVRGFTGITETVGGQRANLVLPTSKEDTEYFLAVRRADLARAPPIVGVTLLFTGGRRFFASAAAAASACSSASASASGPGAQQPPHSSALVGGGASGIATEEEEQEEGHLLLVRHVGYDSRGRVVAARPVELGGGGGGHFSRRACLRLYYRRQRGEAAAAAVAALGCLAAAPLCPPHDGQPFERQQGAVLRQVSERDFDCVSQLGDGAVGAIFLVRHRGSRQLFAIKALRKARMVRQQKVRRCWTELEILESSDHPFIVALHATFQTKHWLCHVLEYCAGGNLWQLLQAQGEGATLRSMAEAHARFYCAEILCGLEYLHHAGFIFRDLKPENVLLAHTGHVRLSDFDLSAVSDQPRPLQTRMPCNVSGANGHGGGTTTTTTTTTFDERDEVSPNG
jgi:hypothetical protein